MAVIMNDRSIRKPPTRTAIEVIEPVDASMPRLSPSITAKSMVTDMSIITLTKRPTK